MKNVHVQLTPGWENGTVTQLKVDLSLNWESAAGEALFGIYDKVIFKPFTRIAEDFALKDDLGSIPFETRSEDRGYLLCRLFVPARKTQGLIKLSYALALDPAGVNPAFDLGNENGGMTGSGMTFMPWFEGDAQYAYRLEWDLSALPDSAVGVWSFGEGAASKVGGGNVLAETFYAAGLLDCVREGNFGYYWFGNEFFLDAAILTSRIFRYESSFFRDAGERYTIITRRTGMGEPRPGGTALMRSYMCSYESENQLTLSWIKFLFAHEMVHNWIKLNDSPFGTCTWYVEGMAEFYSAVLPWRMGIITKQELLDEINKRAAQYYENPKIAVPNEILGKNLMSDREMTRVPYGRGFFYLTHADAEIRKATGGKKCLDDAMFAVMEDVKNDPEARNEAWFKAYGAYVGEEQAVSEYENLRSGGEIIPACDCFGGEICAKCIEGTQRETQSPCKMWVFE